MVTSQEGAAVSRLDVLSIFRYLYMSNSFRVSEAPGATIVAAPIGIVSS